MDKLIIAAVQLRNRPGAKAEAYAVAQHYAEQARSEGAQLVVLPELSCCGYIPNQEIWQLAEDWDGPSVSWATVLAKKLGVYLGAGFVEFDCHDYYNTYFIANPRGDIAGSVRKIHAESYCFRSHHGDNVIATDIGNIGIGICADNHSYTFMQRIQGANPDYMLMPHAWPMPYKVGGAVVQKDIDAARQYAFDLSKVYAEQLGAPTVFANTIGELPPMQGLLGKLMSPSLFHMGGYTHIVCSDGDVLARLDQEEGYIVAEVSQAAAGFKPSPQHYGDWLHPGSGIVRKLVLPLDAAMGHRNYRRNKLKQGIDPRV